MNRRNFLENLGYSSLVVPQLITAQPFTLPQNPNYLGKIDGYSPLVGTMVSMLEWVSNTCINYNKKLTIAQLDYLIDEDANSIGAMIMHVIATEVLYRDLTMKGLDDFSPENSKKWAIAMDLGKTAQEKIKGNNIDYYREVLQAERKTSREMFKNIDDAWMLSGATPNDTDKEWNNYCSWFHVTEHYANHRGQMTWIAKRASKI